MCLPAHTPDPHRDFCGAASFMDVPGTDQVSTGLLPDQMARFLAAAHSLVKTQMSGLSLPSGPSPPSPRFEESMHQPARRQAELPMARPERGHPDGMWLPSAHRAALGRPGEGCELGRVRGTARPSSPSQGQSQGSRGSRCGGPPCAPQGCTSQRKVCPHQAGALRGTSAPLEPSPRVILDVGGFQVSGSFFSSCVLFWGCAGSWLLHAGLSLVVVPQVLTAVTSLAAELSLSHGSAQALLPCGLWDLPGPRIRPAFLASQSGFLTTAPPGTPFMSVLHPQPPG